MSNTNESQNNATANANANANPIIPPADMNRTRRGSVTQAAFTNLFQQRSNSTTQPFPGAVTSAAMNDQRRRLSVTTLGLSGTSPTNPSSFAFRRGSLSTNNSDVIDENAVEEDEGPTRTAPTTPYARRMSLGGRNLRQGGGSPNSSNGRPPPPPPTPVRRGSNFNGAVGGPTPPNSAASANGGWAPALFSHQASNARTKRSPSDSSSSRARPDQGFNWSEQFRSRAESSVTGARPSFSFASGMNNSPPRTGGLDPARHHDRTRSVSDMPIPPAQSPKPQPPPQRDTRPKPDHFQERILKGDFYMD